MQPLDENKRPEKAPELWAPEPLRIPTLSPLEHRQEDEASTPEKPLGSHVVVIDIS